MYSTSLMRPQLRALLDHDDRAAQRSTLLVRVEGPAGVLHGDARAHGGADRARRGQAQQIGVDLVGDVPPEGVEAEPAHARVDRVRPGHHHGHDVDVPDAGHPQRPAGHAIGIVVGEPDGQVAATVGGAAPRALDEVASGQVVDHVGSGIAGRDQDRLDEVLGHVVDDQVGPERGAEGSLLGTAGDGDDPCPGGLAELDPRGAQSAGRRVHHYGLAGLQPTPLEQREVGGLERQQERRRLGVVEARRRVEDRDRVRDGVLGDAPESVLGDGDDPLAQPRLRAVTHRVDDAAHVHAKGERRRRGHRDQVPPAAIDVVEVQGGGTDLDPHLVRPRLGALDRPHRQDVPR